MPLLERARRVDLEPEAAGARGDLLHPVERDDRADAVDVPGNEVAAEPVGQAQGLLQVDPVAYLQAGQGGLPGGVRDDVHREGIALTRVYGQGDPVHRADPQLPGGEERRAHGERLVDV